MTNEQAKKLHDELASWLQLEDIDVEFVTDGDNPNTLVVVSEYYNIEVIYTDVAIMVQENGVYPHSISTNMNWFTWLNNPYWLQDTNYRIKKLIANN